MRCQRCQGLLVEEPFEDVYGAHVWRSWGRRCINCGAREFIRADEERSRVILIQVPVRILSERSYVR